MGDKHWAGADGAQGYGALGAAVGVGLQRAAAGDPQGRRHAAQTSGLQADRGGAEVGAAISQAAAEPAPIAHQAAAMHAQAAGGPQRSQDQVGSAGYGGIGAGLQREAGHARGADPQGRGSTADAPLGGPQFNGSYPVADARAVGGLGQGRGHQAHKAMGFDAGDRQGTGTGQAQAIGAGSQGTGELHRQRGLPAQAHPHQLAGVSDQGAGGEEPGVGHGARGGGAAIG